jgi:hypothetical protein
LTGVKIEFDSALGAESDKFDRTLVTLCLAQEVPANKLLTLVFAPEGLTYHFESGRVIVTKGDVLGEARGVAPFCGMSNANDNLTRGWFDWLSVPRR